MIEQQKSPFAPHEGLFELGATTWLWAWTCPRQRCPCRSVFLLATSGGRDVLLERIASVRAAMNPGDEYAKLAPELRDIVAFDVNIDAGVTSTATDAPIDLAGQADVDIVGCLDGDMLDAFGRLWLRGKGRPTPEQPRPGSTIALAGWQPGDMVAWTNVFPPVRQDLFALDGRVFSACEMYCAVPDCACEDVVVQFETDRPRGGPPQGRVIVPRSGVATIEPSKNGLDRLERLWAAFQARHPKLLDRFVSRSTAMKRTAVRIEPKPASARAKRRCPSPCGSGAKDVEGSLGADNGADMGFRTEPKSYDKTILSDLQGAWENLRADVVDAEPFPERAGLLFHIDEGMSWESVRDLDRCETHCCSSGTSPPGMPCRRRWSSAWMG